MTRARTLTALALLAALVAPAPAQAAPAELVGRAIQPATAPRQGVTVAGYPGQPLGGYSALIPGPSASEYFALPDNGYGTQANSSDFVLRIDRVRVSWRTAGAGTGAVQVVERIWLTDPDRKVPWTITDANGRADQSASSVSPNPNPLVPDSGRRLLTGADFDPEAIRRASDGTFWLGDEFGPFLLHVSRGGRLLDPPVPTPGLRAPENPLPSTSSNGLPASPNLASSRGFESLALSGQSLLPMTEGAVSGTEGTRRPIRRFDLAARRWTSAAWTYCTAQPGYVVSELAALDANRFVAIERDLREGAAAVVSKVFRVDLRVADARGCLVKREVANLLAIADPQRISLLGPVRDGDLMLGDPFGMPYWTTEAVLPLGTDRLAVVNDTNFGSRGRNPGLPDYSDFVLLRQPALRS